MTVPNDEILKDERLLEWRLERFAELGFSAAESSELAESEADWHLADRARVGGLSARAAAPDRPLGGFGDSIGETCHSRLPSYKPMTNLLLSSCGESSASPRCC